MWSQLTAMAVAAAVVMPASATIEVTVGPVRRPVGQVACRLYAAGDGFPESGARAVGQVQRVTGGSAKCVFDRVPPGRYAVAVFHDEDGDLTLSKNVLGVPTEGYGVSNDATHLMQAPSFDEAAFAVGAGERKRLSVPLHY